MKKQQNKFLIIFIVLILSMFTYLILYSINKDKEIKIINDIPKEEIILEKPIRLLFVGDIMLDRGVSFKAERNGTSTIFAGVRDIFKEYDIVIGNLEGTMTDNKSVSRKNSKILRFTFDPLYSEVLKSAGFHILSLANNHTLDFYKDGYEQTVKNLNNVGILSFGSARNEYNLSNKIIIKDKTFCFIGYHDLFTHNEQSAIDEINNIRNECNFTTVFVHWGDEYSTTSNKRQKTLADKFVNADADLIIGSHPHVVQEYAIVNNKAVFYSLGNFVFDQDFSYETKHGIMVGLDIFKDKIDFKLIPIEIENAQVSMDIKKDIEKFTIINEPKLEP